MRLVNSVAINSVPIIHEKKNSCIDGDTQNLLKIPQKEEEEEEEDIGLG